MQITLGQQYDVGEKPTVILYIYINRHAGTPVVFFTLTDRASTIPSNNIELHGCQSGTWSAGQKKIKGTSDKLQ